MTRGVVLGTGRSGSMYIATVLAACGIPAGHEQVYRPDGVNWPAGLLVDSSWMAICYPDRLPWRVWHQVRHPEAVIRSRLASPGSTSGNPYSELRRRWLPPVGDPVVDGMRRYVAWNLACERYATRRWRVEDVNAELVETLAADLGVDCNPVRVGGVPVDTHRHTRDTSWTLNDAPPGADRDAVLALAERYGYL